MPSLPRYTKPVAVAATPCSILCIDADDESRLLVAEILYEHEVDFALTADDAVQLAHCRAYDLYLLDPAVPGFDSLDVVRELRRYDADVPLIICGSADPRIVADEYVQARLSKPLGARDIRETATRLLLRASQRPAYSPRPPDTLAAR